MSLWVAWELSIKLLIKLGDHHQRAFKIYRFHLVICRNHLFFRLQMLKPIKWFLFPLYCKIQVFRVLLKMN